MRKSLIAILGASILVASGPAAAAGEDYPTPITVVGGDFRSQCVGALFKNDMWTMNSRCKVDGKYVQTNSVDILGCGKINFTDGKLVCIPDNYVLMQHMALKNSQAFRSAAVIVMGRDPSWVDLRTWYVWSYPKHAALRAEGLVFSDAALALRDYLKTAATAKERDTVVMAAVTQVYGSQKPAPGQIVVPLQYDAAKYDADIKAGKAWYTTILGDLRKAKNSPNPAPSGSSQPIN